MEMLIFNIQIIVFYDWPKIIFFITGQMRNQDHNTDQKRRTHQFVKVDTHLTLSLVYKQENSGPMFDIF